MNKAALAVSAACMMTVSTSASAEFSANAGVVSQYFFRGIAQTYTASASAGVDYEAGGFYVGTWAADVQDGIEIPRMGRITHAWLRMPEECAGFGLHLMDQRGDGFSGINLHLEREDLNKDSHGFFVIDGQPIVRRRPKSQMALTADSVNESE